MDTDLCKLSIQLFRQGRDYADRKNSECDIKGDLTLWFGFFHCDTILVWCKIVVIAKHRPLSLKWCLTCAPVPHTVVCFLVQSHVTADSSCLMHLKKKNQQKMKTKPLVLHCSSYLLYNLVWLKKLDIFFKFLLDNSSGKVFQMFLPPPPQKKVEFT